MSERKGIEMKVQNYERLNFKFTKDSLVEIFAKESSPFTDNYFSDSENTKLVLSIIEVIKKDNENNQDKDYLEFVEYLNFYEELLKLYKENWSKAFMRSDNILHDTYEKYFEMIAQIEEHILQITNFNDIHYVVWEEYRRMKIRFDFGRSRHTEIESLFEEILYNIANDEHWQSDEEHFKRFLYK